MIAKFECQCSLEYFQKAYFYFFHAMTASVVFCKPLIFLLTRKRTYIIWMNEKVGMYEYLISHRWVGKILIIKQTRTDIFDCLLQYAQCFSKIVAMFEFILNHLYEIKSRKVWLISLDYYRIYNDLHEQVKSLSLINYSGWKVHKDAITSRNLFINT